MAAPVNFLSLNVASNYNLAGLNTAISTTNFDIILLQEVKMSQSQLDSVVSRFGFQSKVNISEDNDQKPGTAVLWRSTVPLSGVVNLVECRLQIAELGPYRILNCYAPSGSENRHSRTVFYGEDVFRYLRLNTGALWVVGGDHNCVIRRADVEGGKGFTTKQCEALKSLVQCERLVDCYIHIHDGTQEFTFHRPGKAKSRLDRFYVSQGLAPSIIKVEHIPSLSDHLGVLLQLNLDVNINRVQSERNFSFWKLNNQILKDDEFLPSFKALWDFLLKSIDDYNDIADWWDIMAKPQIKHFCIAFSSYRKDKRNQTKQMLLYSLKLMMEENDWDEVIRIKARINKMLLDDLMGVKVRSKHGQDLECERASLFHAAREFKNHKNVATGMKINKQIVTDKKIIEEEVVNFFTALFNGHHGKDLKDTGVPFVPDWSGLNPFLEDLGRISDVEREEIIQDIEQDEVHEILDDCPNMKSPGMDGLTYEFYKAVWDIIGKYFVKILQVQLNRLGLIESDKMGATKLASKVDGIPGVDELRPITLLNVDYKLLTKWIAKRLKPLMKKIIRSGQLCGGGNKNILFGVQNILSGVGYVKQKNLGVGLVSLDYFKAYDRVFLPFLIKVLEKMNFCDTFCGWVKMLHQGARTRFILDFLTKDIAVSFSVRQGDPLSMFLYVIYVEPFLVMLEKNLRGLMVGNIRQVLEAFCDDINIFVQDENDMAVLGKIVENFENVSGAILSRNKKCLVLGLGKWKHRTNWSLDYLLPVNEIKVFGIWIKDNYRDLVARNWEYRLEKFRRSVFSWSTRYFDTVLERIEVIKCFGLSRVYYVASVLPMNSRWLKSFNKIIGDFLWKRSGKVLKIPMSEIINNIERGGMGLQCLETMNKSLILTQLFRLMKSEDDKSKKHLNFWLQDILSDMWNGPVVRNEALECVHFNLIAEILVEAKIHEHVRVASWQVLTNKVIYTGFANGFTKTKVEREAAQPMGLVWARLQSLKMNRAVQEANLLLVHNKLPVKERLFRIGLSGDPYCEFCDAAVIQDTLHYFTQCERVEVFWIWVRTVLYQVIGAQADLILDSELLSFSWTRCRWDREIVWLISWFVWFIWRGCDQGSSRINGRELFGFMRFKYKEARNWGLLSAITGLL